QYEQCDRMNLLRHLELNQVLGCLFYFFSSRRRHTRSKRDWSSDVCSSDLPSGRGKMRATNNQSIKTIMTPPRYAYIGKSAGGTRSEERRVGKERRYQRFEI